jgi:hypothetical protein
MSPTSRGWSETVWTFWSKYEGLKAVVKSADLLLDAIFGVAFLLFVSYAIWARRFEFGRFALLFFVFAAVPI